MGEYTLHFLIIGFSNSFGSWWFSEALSGKITVPVKVVAFFYKKTCKQLKQVHFDKHQNLDF